ncbi:hypothetical protein CC80DRAFT_487749 [Byssothecium circinans]|uniref:Rhodopsin domain-containing protein n=1 Tax=Byssothecium circinans TaxID=147558 RepID=A0A6A5UH34_9PLEO|nr:hypothetical protein CC80DRAFT_487749 [Byssothecium circinans]
MTSATQIDLKAIQSISLNMLKLIPAEAPPPGITPNFEHPASLASAIVGVGSAFLTLAFFCFTIRIYTQSVITKKWHWDDLTCTVGFMCGIVYYAFAALGCLGGSGGKHLYDLHLDIVLNRASSLQSYLATIIVTPALGLIKCSIFIQYYRIFRPLRYVSISVYVGATISAIFYAAVTIAAFVLNSPWPGESLLSASMSWHFMRFTKFSIPTGVIGMLVDWCLFCLPIPAVHSLHLSLEKKLGIMLVFMTGGLAAIASTMALYYRVRMQQDPGDIQWKVGYIFIWTQIEMFAGVAATSMPSVKQFFNNKSISPLIWGSLIIASLAHLFKCPAHTTSRCEKLDDPVNPGGFYPLEDLLRAWPGPYDFSITSQGTIHKVSTAHVQLPRDTSVVAISGRRSTALGRVGDRSRSELYS